MQARWQTELQAFAATDRAHAPGGIVAVGGSSIRFFWSSTLPTDFP